MRKTKKGPDHIDRHVGEQIRRHRLAKEISQTTLAEALGITFQQVQKYEKGTNRVAPSRLMRIAEHFGVPVAEFYPSSGQVSAGGPVDGGDPLVALGQTRNGMRLARAFVELDDSETQRMLVELIEGVLACLNRAGRQ